MRLVSASQMRAIARAAIEGMGIPGLELMERAGAAVARAAGSLLGRGGCVLAVCGAGNNGGDGYVAARVLRQAGTDARVAALTPRDRLRGDALAARELAERAGVPIQDLADPDALAARAGDVIIDALFGTGLARPPEGAYARAIARLAALREGGARVVAVDVPSGLSSDTGRPLGPCVRADRTVTFAFQKRGLVLYPGPAFAGEISVVDIGIPAAAAARVPVEAELLTADEARALVPPLRIEAHKGDAGRGVGGGGSTGKTRG